MKTKSIVVSAAASLFFFVAFALPAAASGPNTIANPSVETASSNPSIPLSWFKGGYGANTRVLDFPVAGHTGSNAVKATISGYTNGDAKWYFQPVTVSGGQTFDFSNWYTSDVSSKIGLEYRLQDGSVRHPLLNTIPAASSWTQYQKSFTVPTNYGSPVVSVTVFHSIYAVGSITTDDFSLQLHTPQSELVPNPSLETASSNPAMPLSWFKGGSGSNTKVLTYPVSGHTGTSAVKAEITSYVSGNARWYFAPVAVTGGGAFIFSDWYTSTIPSTINLQYRLQDGTYRNTLLGTLPAAPAWTQVQKIFTVSTNYGSPVVSVTVLHSIAAVGSVTTDDYSLEPISCAADTWTCSAFSSCSSLGSQSRTCSMTFDCPSAVTPSPVTVQACSAPAPSGGGAGTNPTVNGNRYVALVSPTNGETFALPLNLRFVAMGADGNIYNNVPVNGKGHNADKVDFYVDNILAFSENGSGAEYGIFKGFANDISVNPGQHQVWARATYVNPALVLDSPVFTITVQATPAYAQTIDLTQDVVLSGSQSYSLIGTPTGRIRLNGNGFSITSNATNGSLTLRYVDVFDLGSRVDTSLPAIDVGMPGGVIIEDSTFDSSNQVAIRLDGVAPGSIRRNLFRSNMRMPIGQQPGAPDTFQVIRFTGNSSAAKVFAGNNVAAGPIGFYHTDNWTIGGTAIADSNILIGARTAFEVDSSTNTLIEGNYVHHVYYGDWSQGQLMELGGSLPITVQHNVLQGSSWPVRFINGEFSYNLVLNGGHEWMWPSPHARINHNLFIGGANDVGGITEYYDNNDIVINNNTFDGLNNSLMQAAINWKLGSATLRSNAFVRVPASAASATVVKSVDATIDVDYSAFDDLQTTNYSDGRLPAHDILGGAQTDFHLAGPLPASPFEGDEVAVWKRTLTVSSILAGYRARYAPATGSPLIDSGDPAGGAGNDVGAIGGGTVNALDKFGSFGIPGWTPPATP